MTARRPSLRLRLFLGIMLPLIVIALASAAVRYRSAQDMSRELYDNTLKVVAHAIARDVALTKGDVLADALLDSLVGALGDPIYYQVSAPEGGYLTGYSDAPFDAAEISLPGGEPVFRDARYLGEPVRVVMLREFIADPQFSGWTTVQVWQTVSQRRALSLNLLAQGALMLGLVLAATGALVWYGINWGLRPLTDLRAAVAQRSPEELDPIRRPVPREAAPLVAAINRLFERLREAFERRDVFIANAAHQLRNPVASIQAQAEAARGARDEAELRARLEDLVAAARRTSRLTRQLLSFDLATQRPVDANREPVDLRQLAESVTARHVPRALDQHVELSLEPESEAPARIAGDPVLLEEALDNLIDNALRYGCPEGGTIRVRIADGPAGVSVAVNDDGPGICAELSEVIFERFTRLSGDSGSGCGLGLSIVRMIAERHGGRVEVGTSAEGGACFTLVIPAAAQFQAAAE